MVINVRGLYKEGIWTFKGSAANNHWRKKEGGDRGLFRLDRRKTSSDALSSARGEKLKGDFNFRRRRRNETGGSFRE